MNRRALLSLLAAGTTGLAGCGTQSGETDTQTPGTGTSEETATPQEKRFRQTLTLWNPTPNPVFVTTVGIRDGRDVFFENTDLLPGERLDTRVFVPDGDIDVLIETDTGLRTNYVWTMDPELDGLEVVIDSETIEFWRRMSCSPTEGCTFDMGGESDELPLVGDGQSRWYAPAGVVIENPGRETTVQLAIDWYENSILNRQFRIPAKARFAVPVTYRTGRYRILVTEADEPSIQAEWLVPDEPTKYVDLASGNVGCGPANSTLSVVNSDDVPHRISVEIESRTGLVEEAFDLDPGESQSFAPVTESGQYEVFARLENGSELSQTWWSCPPRGPATVVIVATGALFFDVGGPQPG